MDREAVKLKIKDTSKALFTDRLWSLNLNELSSKKRGFVKFVKLIRITLDTFAENKIGFQCVALSYFCTMALIPLLAVLFAVSGGLGLTDKIQAFLYNVIPTNPEMINTLTEKAGNIITTARSGIVGAVAALTFIWTILWMMFQIERVFNNVWGITKVPRKIYKRFSFYLLALILLPFVIIIFGFGIVVHSRISTWIGIGFGDLKFLPTLLTWLGFFVVTTFTLSAMYKFIPATKVVYRNALIAAVVAGLVFTVFQYLYLETQMFVTNLNGVYGALAAVPLFLMWLNFSWQIIMYGAELSYGIQNVDQYHIPDDITLKDAMARKRRRRRAKDTAVE